MLTLSQSNFLNIVRNLENTSGRLAKESILADADQLTLYLFKHCYNNYICTGISKIDWYTVDRLTDKFDDGLEFIQLLKSFETVRPQASDNHRLSIYRALAKIKPDDREICSRVLFKNMDCGIGIPTLQKLFGIDFVPVFEAQGCTAAKTDTDLMKQLKKFQGKVVHCEPKLDGQRMLTRFDPSTGELSFVSRNGLPVHSVTNQMTQELTILCNKMTEHSKHVIWLDGEIMNRDGFQSLMQSRRSVNKIDADNYYVVFASTEEIDSKVSTKLLYSDTQDYVSNSIVDIYKDLNTVVPIEVMTFERTKVDEIIKYYSECLKKGFEGIIIKDDKGTYEFAGHVKHWIKMKPTDTADLTIVDFEVGTGKNSERLGNLIVEGIIDNKLIKTSVSGITDAMRDYIWQNRTKLFNKTVEVKYQEITEQRGNGTYALRFPRFVRIREDK